MWAWAAGADAAGEASAVLAALLCEQALAAVGAFVDGVFASALGWRDGDRGDRVLVAPPERGLATWCAAEALASHRCEPGLADGAGHRRVVVARRGWLHRFGHGGRPGQPRAAVRRPSKAMSKAFNADFHRLDQRARPLPVGSRLIVVRYNTFSAALSVGKWPRALTALR